jgi:O-antigen ligase
MWRLLLVWLFVVTAIKQIYQTWSLRVPQGGTWQSMTRLLRYARNDMQAWDWWLLGFGIVLVLSMLVARYPVESAKQIIFVANAALLYVVVRFVVTGKEHIRSVIAAAATSTGLIVALGYMQYIATFFSVQYYFWQYWAMRVSSLYYGQGLADVLAYSNSWFSTSTSGSSLRMFSIMPDSHSFAMVAALFVAFVLSIMYFRKQEAKRNGWLWFLVVIGALAIMFAGTRGVWVGMLAPLVVAPVLYYKRVARSTMKLNLAVYGIILLLFVLSPLISQGIGFIRSVGLGSFLDRATSVYDLSEQSNVGRIEIWKESSRYAVTHPLGVGYGNFIVSLVHDIPAGTSYESIGELPNKRYNLPQKFITAHNLYLHVLVELGALGLIAFSGFILSVLCSLWKFLQTHAESLHAGYIATFGLIGIWFLAYAVFDVTLFNDKILLYTFTGLGLAGVTLQHYQSDKH